jgi:anti-sigma factor RsiW
VDCEELFENVTDLLDGALSHRQEAMALEHLSTCPECDRVLRQTREVTRLVAEHGRSALGGDRRREILDRILRSIR